MIINSSNEYSSLWQIYYYTNDIDTIYYTDILLYMIL